MPKKDWLVPENDFVLENITNGEKSPKLKKNNKI